MPQLDKVTFYSQVFWLFSIFLTFFQFNVQFLLPKVAFVFKSREQMFWIQLEIFKFKFFEQFDRSVESADISSSLDKRRVHKYNFLFFWYSFKNVNFLLCQEKLVVNFFTLFDKFNFFLYSKYVTL